MQQMCRIGASGLRAFSTQVDIIANNVANVNTRDFVRSDSVFTGLTSAPLANGKNPVLQDGNSGHGVAVTPRHDFSHPGLLFTGNLMDLGLSGQGFFRLELDGTVFYSNRGEFYQDGDGRLVHCSGAVIPDVHIPPGGEISVNSLGEIWVILGDDETQVGSLEIVNFANPQGLEHIGYGCFRETTASGGPVPDTLGQVKQGYRRAPSVDFAEEMTRLMMAQRAYQLSSRVVRTADELWEKVNDLRR